MNDRVRVLARVLLVLAALAAIVSGQWILAVAIVLLLAAIVADDEYR